MDYSIIQFPSSALLAGVFLLAVFALFYYAGNNKIVKAMASVRVAQCLLAVGAVLLAIEGTWSVPIHSHPGFVVYVLAMMGSLFLTILYGFVRRAKVSFLLNHTGILLILWGSLFGAPDVISSRLIVHKDQSVKMAYGSDGLLVSLPFEVSLEEFIIDYYDDGVSPRQFTSKLLVDGKKMVTSVNHPCSYKGFTLYQDSYDQEFGQYSVLQVVRAPWLPFVYIGFALLAIGSVMLLFGKWRAKLVIPVTLVLTVIFTIFTVAKINFGTLMPALRSWWFVPHLFIYMVAYSLMALALIFWLVDALALRKSDSSLAETSRWRGVSDNLVRSSSALLIIGMLTGSVWARQAWGDYWAWDAKENWAAVTWFISLIHLHLSSRKGWKAIVILILAFLALQITWYGVNYLPSAVESLHTYNG